jgi:hypothetical protein
MSRIQQITTACCLCITSVVAHAAPLVPEETSGMTWLVAAASSALLGSAAMVWRRRASARKQRF